MKQAEEMKEDDNKQSTESTETTEEKPADSKKMELETEKDVIEAAAKGPVEADEKRAIRVQSHWHRRLSDLSADRLTTQQQPVVFQTPHDHRDGLHR